MPACERCWAESRRPFATETYEELVKINNCTPEQQAGPDAGICSTCGRKTIHQYARDWCMACDCQREERE